MSLVDTLAAVRDQLVKARVEITGKIADLESALAAAGEPTPEVTAALDDLVKAAAALDDVVPDAPVEVPVEEEASEPVDPVE